jgi:hypothetical protein
MKTHRVFVPSYGPADWRARLADPLLHWKRRKSAWELAVSWEGRRETVSGLPPEIEKALNAHPQFASARLLLAIPEHKVTLDDDRKPSQNDLWAILSTNAGLASVTIEAKAGEDFDRTIDEWLKDDSRGKKERLAFLTETLGLGADLGGHIRYQLLHRTASALIEAKRWGLQTALMLVQSFSESSSSWSDYCNFTRLLGATPQRGTVVGPRRVNGIDLFTAWIDSPLADDSAAANAM